MHRSSVRPPSAAAMPAVNPKDSGARRRMAPPLKSWMTGPLLKNFSCKQAVNKLYLTLSPWGSKLAVNQLLYTDGPCGPGRRTWPQVGRVAWVSVFWSVSRISALFQNLAISISSTIDIFHNVRTGPMVLRWLHHDADLLQTFVS